MRKAEEISNSCKYWINVPGTKIIAIEFADFEPGTETLLPKGLPVVLRVDLADKKIETPEGGIVQLVSLEQSGHSVILPINPSIPKEVESWAWEWQIHQDPHGHRWHLSKMTYKYGANIYTDWECGPSPVIENSLLFKTVLREARSLIEIMGVDTHSPEDRKQFFNFFVDIALLSFGQFEWGDDDDQEGFERYIVNYTWQLWTLLSCNSYTPSGTDWFAQDDEVFLSELTPMWD